MRTKERAVSTHCDSIRLGNNAPKQRSEIMLSADGGNKGLIGQVEVVPIYAGNETYGKTLSGMSKRKSVTSDSKDELSVIHEQKPASKKIKTTKLTNASEDILGLCGRSLRSRAKSDVVLINDNNEYINEAPAKEQNMVMYTERDRVEEAKQNKVSISCSYQENVNPAVETTNFLQNKFETIPIEQVKEYNKEQYHEEDREYDKKRSKQSDSGGEDPKPYNKHAKSYYFQDDKGLKSGEKENKKENEPNMHNSQEHQKRDVSLINMERNEEDEHEQKTNEVCEKKLDEDKEENGEAQEMNEKEEVELCEKEVEKNMIQQQQSEVSTADCEKSMVNKVHYKQHSMQPNKQDDFELINMYQVNENDKQQEHEQGTHQFVQKDFLEAEMHQDIHHNQQENILVDKQHKILVDKHNEIQQSQNSSDLQDKQDCNQKNNKSCSSDTAILTVIPDDNKQELSKDVSATRTDKAGFKGTELESKEAKENKEKKDEDVFLDVTDSQLCRMEDDLHRTAANDIIPVTTFLPMSSVQSLVSSAVPSCSKRLLHSGCYRDVRGLECSGMTNQIASVSSVGESGELEMKIKEGSIVISGLITELTSLNSSLVHFRREVEQYKRLVDVRKQTNIRSLGKQPGKTFFPPTTGRF